jgi:hypothetical protein
LHATSISFTYIDLLTDIPLIQTLSEKDQHAHVSNSTRSPNITASASMFSPSIHSFIELYDLVVGIGLGQILLQESQVLVSGLGSVGGRCGLLGGSGASEGWLLGVELGQLGSEVGWESRSLGG